MRALRLGLALLALSPTFASADVIVGGAVTETRLRTNVSGIDFQASDRGFKLHAAKSFFEFLEIEAGYLDLGTPDDTAGGSRLASDLRAYDVLAVGVLPLGPVHLFAKAGVARWEADTVVTPPVGPAGSTSENGTDPIYGAGVSVHLAPILWLRAEYERIELGSGRKLEVVSAGVDFRF